MVEGVNKWSLRQFTFFCTQAAILVQVWNVENPIYKETEKNYYNYKI
jgi:hypothetical protein